MTQAKPASTSEGAGSPPLLPARQPQVAAPDGALPALTRFHLGSPAALREAPAAGAMGYLPALLHPSCQALVGEAAGEPPTAELEALIASMPAAAGLPSPSGQTPLELLMHAAASLLSPARTAFREEARALAAEAEALLAADRQRRPESRASGTVGGSLGELGSRFLDPSALAGMLDARSGGTALSAERRARLEEARAALDPYLAAEEAPVLILVHDGGGGLAGLETLASEGGGWRVELRQDPCAAAAEIFDHQAEALARVLRAVRRIRLETAGNYDPERQDPWLESFDWQAFSRRELLLLTPVVALVAAGRVAGVQMAALSGLLRSGRPIQVLVPVSPAVDAGAEDGAEPLSGFRFEPAYLGLAHREALVQQTSIAVPAHMLRGFLRALSATHAGLHVVSVGGGESPAGDSFHAAALASRAHPLFLYDPENGASWAERFDFSQNPQAEVDWPVHALETRRPDGSREALEMAFTFADFALLEPAYASHFHVIPEGVPETELLPVAEAVSRPMDAEAVVVPYVWAIDGSGRLVRLAISRPLTMACRDRLDFWRTLQELSGVRSEHVRRAEARLRQELAAETQQQHAELETRHARELEHVRHDAARDVVDRLTAALLEVDVAAFAGPASPFSSGPLAGLQGRGVDEVAAALLAIVDPGSLDAEDAAAGGAGVDQLASELLGLVAAT